MSETMKDVSITPCETPPLPNCSICCPVDCFSKDFVLFDKRLYHGFTSDDEQERTHTFRSIKNKVRILHSTDWPTEGIRYFLVKNILVSSNVPDCMQAKSLNELELNKVHSKLFDANR